MVNVLPMLAVLDGIYYKLHFYLSVVSCLYNISVSVVYSDKGQGSGLDHLDWELMA